MQNKFYWHNQLLFSHFFLYHEVFRFRLNQTFRWNCTCHTSLSCIVEFVSWFGVQKCTRIFMREYPWGCYRFVNVLTILLKRRVEMYTVFRLTSVFNATASYNSKNKLYIIIRRVRNIARTNRTSRTRATRRRVVPNRTQVREFTRWSNI